MFLTYPELTGKLYVERRKRNESRTVKGVVQMSGVARAHERGHPGKQTREIT